MTPLLVVGALLVGLAVGSFLNVVIWRVPRGESVVHPPSACPRCGRAIRPYDNVPVVSWLVLRGRCRDCGEPIAVRYPLVEAGTGVLFALAAWWTGPSWFLPALLYLLAISVALALIDIDTRRLPDAIVKPAYPVSLALLALASANPGGEADWAALLRAAVGGAAMFVAYLLMVLAYPRGMGWGDVKLAGVMGLYLGWVGWGALLIGWFAAFVLGGVFGLALIVVRRAGRKSSIPFGPWLLLGTLVGIVAGEAVWGAYLGAL
ncbi:prepilin peptidase [Cellulomonas fimi]|uniref:prepilin peptidase n=1 Tax=Cellulomonas fimi TaxID=1708 RepID=UPI0023598F46|nr:A24 family peptidase [Cellulomonas fimi]